MFQSTSNFSLSRMGLSNSTLSRILSILSLISLRFLSSLSQQFLRFLSKFLLLLRRFFSQLQYNPSLSASSASFCALSIF
ncbi:hypothetical protein FGO68_gene16876 [Halteria grandinella]|uniref:Uncharacterized protein n=1 Tax=Halteria grandinella TaxID=5974 RepID=A0A8J8SVY3_HALGN|nr:hypothetical protein FGO68_gene16876 [Halteria grandinella]